MNCCCRLLVLWSQSVSLSDDYMRVSLPSRLQYFSPDSFVFAAISSYDMHPPSTVHNKTSTRSSVSRYTARREPFVGTYQALLDIDVSIVLMIVETISWFIEPILIYLFGEWYGHVIMVSIRTHLGGWDCSPRFVALSLWFFFFFFHPEHQCLLSNDNRHNNTHEEKKLLLSVLVGNVPRLLQHQLHRWSWSMSWSLEYTFIW